MKTKDSLFNELRDIRQQMMGISPKLSLYQLLKNKEREILAELGDIYVEPPVIRDQIPKKVGIKYVNIYQRPK